MPKDKAYVKILAIAVSVIVLANNSVFNVGLGNVYYAVLIAALAVLLIRGKRPVLNFTMFFFIIACLCSILVNDIPYFFKPLERFAAFVLIVALIGPFVQNPALRVFKNLLFKYLNYLTVVMVLLSFLGLITNSSLVYLGRGGFTGLFNHSMFLSPMGAISMLTCAYYGVTSLNKRKKTIWYLFAFSSFIVCLTAGSRAALMAGIVGILYFFYKINKQNLKQYFKIILATLFIGVISFPLWHSYTDKITQKMEYAEEQGGLLTTRESLWERRLDEFNSSPIFGIGFANDSSQTENDLIIGGGQIEPGSSWLVILSMTGIFGTITFLVLLFKLITKEKKKRESFYTHYQYSLLIFFAIHLFAEGYLLSAGSGLFFYFWLLLGAIASNKYVKSNNKMMQA